MTFKSPRKNIVYNPDLHINNTKIHLVNKTKFSGIFIDSNLNWSHYIMYKGKLSKGDGIIQKARRVLKKGTLLKIYYAFVYTILI